MTTLNSTLVPTAEVRRAFLAEPERCLFPVGTILTRFGTGKSPWGSWWLTVEHLRELRTTADRLEVPLLEVARSLLAVKMAWNERMDVLVSVRLLVPVYGWSGRARSQTWDRNPRSKNVSFIGGHGQVWMPNLGPGENESVSRVAEVLLRTP